MAELFAHFDFEHYIMCVTAVGLKLVGNMVNEILLCAILRAVCLLIVLNSLLRQRAINNVLHVEYKVSAFCHGEIPVVDTLNDQIIYNVINFNTHYLSVVHRHWTGRAVGCKTDIPIPSLLELKYETPKMQLVLRRVVRFLIQPSQRPGPGAIIAEHVIEELVWVKLPIRRVLIIIQRCDRAIPLQIGCVTKNDFVHRNIQHTKGSKVTEATKLVYIVIRYYQLVQPFLHLNGKFGQAGHLSVARNKLSELWKHGKPL